MTRQSELRLRLPEAAFVFAAVRRSPRMLLLSAQPLLGGRPRCSLAQRPLLLLLVVLRGLLARREGGAMLPGAAKFRPAHLLPCPDQLGACAETATGHARR